MHMNGPDSEQAPPGDVASIASDSFGPWLGATGGSLVISCYQAGKIAVVGWNGRAVTVHLRDFPRPMGLAVDGPRMAVGTLEEVVLLQNAPALAPDVFPEQRGRHDALYLPRVHFRTGEIAVHGIGFGNAGLWIVNTRFSCLASLSEEFHFVPRWKPPFVSDLAPEDRCHMNGMAMIEGEPRFVTCLGTTDVAGTWRTDKVAGGVIVSVPDGRIVAQGLAMPHTPRWYDGRLWVLNSGHGQLGYINASGAFEVVCSLPGYLRGLCFLGPFAVVGMCQIRERHVFGGLPVSQKYDELFCGLAVVDLRTAAPIATFRFTSGCQEVFEVDFLPGVKQGVVLNNDHESVKLSYTAPGRHWWRRDE
jgi:uncharacterized protein (TIGR03032 family)